jgi:hypothetical protein
VTFGGSPAQKMQTGQHLSTDISMSKDRSTHSVDVRLPILTFGEETPQSLNAHPASKGTKS